jgi:hypothetical protein
MEKLHACWVNVPSLPLLQHGGGDEIDEMVRRNIEEAVKAAELGSGGAGTSFLDEHGGGGLSRQGACGMHTHRPSSGTPQMWQRKRRFCCARMGHR